MKSISINFRPTIILSFMVLLAIFAGTFSQKARADLAVVQNGAEGQVVNKKTGQVFPVWVTQGSAVYELIAVLDFPIHDEKSTDTIRLIRQAATPAGCHAFGEGLPDVKRLVRFSIICNDQTRPDANVQPVPKTGASAKLQSDLRPALYYINHHRGFRVPLT